MHRSGKQKNRRLFSRNTVYVPFVVLFIFITSSPSPGFAASGHVPGLFPPLQGAIPSPETLRGCGGARFASSNADFEAEIVQLINRIRMERNLPPLKRADDLDASARFHAADMAVEGYFSHNGYDLINGSLTESCLWSERIRTYYGDWWSVAENIAAGFSTPQDVVDGWMNSPGHRRNILSETNWEIGVGYFEGAGVYGQYWVQDFGRRPDVYPLVIDGEAAVTENGEVTLYIYGNWDEVRLRTDEGPWSEWQPFQVPLNWRIEGLAGVHTVYAEMRSSDGSMALASDEIYLAQTNVELNLNEMPDQLLFYLYADIGRVAPDRYEIQPCSQHLPGDYFWRVEANGGWFDVEPTQGVGPEMVEIIPTATGANEVHDPNAIVSVTLRDGSDNVVAEHTIALSLTIIEAVPYTVYIPLVTED